MVKAGFNINYVAVHFVIHKTIAYRTTNRFVQRKQAGDRPRSGRQNKLTPLKECVIEITSRREGFITGNSLCITSRNCLWYVSIHQNRLEPSQMHVDTGKNTLRNFSVPQSL